MRNWNGNIKTRKLSINTLFLSLSGLLSVFITGCNIPDLEITDNPPPIDSAREAVALTAFFGLDNDLPPRAFPLYWRAWGLDGMPVVFSQEVDPETLQEEDFTITTKSGKTYIPDKVNLLPANEYYELRTALLIGEFGDYPEDPPTLVSISGDLMSRWDENFKGQSLEVIPLPDGPTIAWAEYFAFDHDYPYVASGRGCDCPKDSTKIVTRIIWTGGVRAMNGEDLQPYDVEPFSVLVWNGTDTTEVTPFKIADLADNDNFVDLCLAQDGIPLKAMVKENSAIDPNDDPNPYTEREVVSRW